jgi:hypothetical protein
MEMTEFIAWWIDQLRWQQELLKQSMATRLIPGMEQEFDRQFLAMAKIVEVT